MILQRKKLRVLYSDCCQNIIRLNFKILQFRRSFNEINLSNSTEYASYIKELDKESHNKIVYKREIENLTINSDMDKLADLEAKFRENLTNINNNLSSLNETNLKIKKMKKNQKKLLENIEECLKITSN